MRDRSPVSMPATVERLVVEVLGQELSRPELSTNGTGSWGAETRAVVRDTVERVDVQCGELQIIRKRATTSATTPDQDSTPRRSPSCRCPIRGLAPERRSSSLAARFFAAPNKPRSHSRHRPCHRGCETFEAENMPTRRRSPATSNSTTPMSAAFCDLPTLRPISSRRLSKVASPEP
jgi:hypothetical protein